MRSRLAILALVAAFPFVACDGDDGVGLSGDPLSEAEAAALAEYVVIGGLDQGFSAYEQESQSQAPARAPFTRTETYSATIECQQGGTVAVDASFTVSGDTEVEGEATLDFSLTQAHDDCAVIPGDSDVEFTLNGEPAVSFNFVIELTNGEDIAADGDLTGAVSWATDDGRSGTCPVNMGYTLGFDLGTEQGSATLEGTICGVDLSRSIDVGAPA